MRWAGAMIILWWIGAVVRLRTVSEAVVSSDSLGPYLQAYAARLGHLPRPPNPESGDALWFLVWPLLYGADSLSSLFQLRFALGGIVAPLGFAAAWFWTDANSSSARRWAGALSAGLLLAFDPGLIDTLISGARSYGAPELVGVSTVALALCFRGVRWAPMLLAASLVLAAGHHPLAAGMGLIVLLMVPTLRAAVGDQALIRGVLLGAVLAIPRLWRLGKIAFCGEGFSQCIGAVARSNLSTEEPMLDVLTRAFHDRFWVDLGPGAWLVILGLGLIVACTHKRHRWAGYFAIGGLLGVVLLGMATGYIRSYHLRILAVPIAVAAAMGLARAWPLALIATGICAVQWNGLQPVGPDPGAVHRIDDIASALPDRGRTLWVDGLWWGGPPRLDAAAVVLSAMLQGRSPADFALDPGALFLLLVHGDGPRPPGERLLQGEGWAVKITNGAQATAVWLDDQVVDPHQVGGGYDWATILDPSTTLENAHWWSENP